MHTHPSSIEAPWPPGVADRLNVGSRIRHLHRMLSVWHQRAQRRRELLEIPESLLRDIGIAPEDIYREVRKPFWRA